MAIGMVLLSTLIALLSAGVAALTGAGLLSILASYVTSAIVSFLVLVSFLVAKEFLICRQSSLCRQVLDEGPPP